MMIELEARKLGEGLRTLVPWTIVNPLANISCNDINFNVHFLTSNQHDNMGIQN